MTYLVTFLEGIMSFISPCMLPLLPVYLSFFAGGDEGERKKAGRIVCFVIGFTFSFMVLGLLFSVIGRLVSTHQIIVNLVCGAIMILFGLHYMDIIHLKLFGRGTAGKPIYSYASALVFGIIYPVNMTPCIGVFLGSALALAATSASLWQGVSLLLVYSLGLGIPFVISAVLISRLDVLFTAIKKHYSIVSRVCGIFLIAVGILTACGVMNRLLRLFI